jgi:arabinofuranosyltransferase
MDTKTPGKRLRPVAVFLVTFGIALAVTSGISLYNNFSSRSFSVTLSRFQSDFVHKEETKDLYAEHILRKNKFIAYGSYTTLSPGIYEANFYLDSGTSQISSVGLQLAAEKGREILADQTLKVRSFPSQQAVRIKILEKKEIEPRVLFLSGNSSIHLEKVILNRIKGVFPWKNIVFQSLLSVVFITLLLLSILSSSKRLPRWKFFLTLFLFLAGFFLILRTAWVSEDAFITLRHVDNFIEGYGPVFNLNERVEGYTHPLWFAIISLFRWLGLSPKGSVILPGLILSFSALLFLLFRIRFKASSNSGAVLNPAAAILIGTSAFIDFGTGGLETSLSYLLLVLYAKFLAEDRWKSQPMLMGILVALLVFTRPDFGVFLIFLIVFYLYELFRKSVSIKHFVFFLSPPLLFLGLHELFRMGYYAALMPNPFYSKSGSAAHFSQGLKYLIDFGQGSLGFGIFLLALLAVALNIKQGNFKNRLLVFSSGLLHGFFVIRGGGDFMHGRFLLPAILLFTASAAGAFDRFFEKKLILNKAYILVSLGLFVLSLSIIPVQKKGKFYNFGISDERYAYYKDQIMPIKYLFRDTVILMWKTIGINYRDLSIRARLKIRLAYLNVGFTGFYSGKNIYLIDRLGLTDPVVSRIALEKRGRPGHEKSAPFGYLVLRKLTFGETPFPLWNEAAETRYGVLWDLSPKTLEKLADFLDDDLKNSIDTRVTDYLSHLKEEDLAAQADFLFFLKEFWYPFAPEEQKKLFKRSYKADVISKHSPSLLWIEEHNEKVDRLLSHLEGPLNAQRFFQNVKFALTEGRQLQF